MSLPGFTADTSLLKTIDPYLVRAEVIAASVRLQQFTIASRANSISQSTTVSGCFDIDYVPVCRGNPVTPFGRCCDFTHERICNGRRVSICTFTECTSFPDTNTSVLT